MVTRTCQRCGGSDFWPSGGCRWCRYLSRRDPATLAAFDREHPPLPRARCASGVCPDCGSSDLYEKGDRKGRCRPCYQARDRKKYLVNRETVIERSKARVKAMWQADPEGMRAYAREAQRRHRAKLRAPAN